MKKLCLSLILLSLATLANAAPAPQSARIVGGVQAAQGEFPYIVSLQAADFGGHFCAGTLIRKDWVLTAAHCVTNTVAVSKLKLVLGLHVLGQTAGTETLKAKRYVVHPEYAKKTESDFDYALIQLASPSSKPTLALGTERVDIPESEADSPIAVVAGWGATDEGSNLSQTLLKVEVPLTSDKRCDAAYPKEITDRMICAGLEAGQKDSCQGDSGGPLVLNHKLIGIVSWGEGCARPHKFGVYSRVSEATSWIAKQIQ